jgi:hypothetical protein
MSEPGSSRHDGDSPDDPSLARHVPFHEWNRSARQRRLPKRIPVIVAILAGACVPMGKTTLQPPSRAGTTVAAPRESTWNALLTVWSENARSLGVITHTDAENGLLVASLSRTSSAAVARDLPRWGTCHSRASLTLDPDSMTWTVVVRGTEVSSTLRASALFWKPGLDCVSHGIREAELEQLVRTTAEAAGGAPRLPTPQDGTWRGRAVLSESECGTCSIRRAGHVSSLGTPSRRPRSDTALLIPGGYVLGCPPSRSRADRFRAERSSHFLHGGSL